jgi:hypothetical protein
MFYCDICKFEYRRKHNYNLHLETTLHKANKLKKELEAKQSRKQPIKHFTKIYSPITISISL